MYEVPSWKAELERRLEKYRQQREAEKKQAKKKKTTLPKGKCA